ncbi:MAG: Hsp20 family protein [Terriglobia bacterium]
MAEQSTAVQRAKEAAPLRITPIDDIFDRVNEMYNAIARQAFELFDGRNRQEGHDFDDWIRAESELFHPAHLEVSETDDAFAVQAEVPGFKADELQVSLEPRRLTIMGQRQSAGSQKQGKKVYTDRCCNQIFRAVDLPADADPSKATATLKDGILDLTLPKATPARKVSVEQKIA